MFNTSFQNLRENQDSTQNNMQIHNKSFRLQKQLKEFNYSTALADSNQDENQRLSGQSNLEFNHDYLREQRRKGNSYLQKSSLQSDFTNHQNSLEANKFA